MPAKIEKDKCEGCGVCVESCPVNAISIKEGKAEISDDCVGCGVCVSQCPTGAISLDN